MWRCVVEKMEQRGVRIYGLQLSDDVAYEIVEGSIGDFDFDHLTRHRSCSIVASPGLVRNLGVYTVDIYDPVDFRSQSFVASFEQELRLLGHPIDENVHDGADTSLVPRRRNSFLHGQDF